jgi:hypothetical protein
MMSNSNTPGRRPFILRYGEPLRWAEPIEAIDGVQGVPSSSESPVRRNLRPETRETRVRNETTDDQ